MTQAARPVGAWRRGGHRLGRLVSARAWHLAAGSLAAGLALAASAPSLAPALAALALGTLAVLRHPLLALACAGLVTGGAALGDLRLASIDAPAHRLRGMHDLNVRATVGGRRRAARFGSEVELRVVAGRAAGARLLAGIPRWVPWPSAARVGAEVLASGALRRVGRRGGFAAYLRRRGIAGQLTLDRVRPTGRRRGGLSGRLDRAQARAERAVAAGLPRAPGALLRGMVLGEDEQIAEPVRDDFRASGLAHLLAVSGQNVMLLAALAVPVLGAMGLGSGPRAAALLVLIALYVPLAGAGPSLQRAGVMGAAGVVALSASRPASRSYALLLAAAVTLIVNPRACGDPGWQLSFASVAGILWIAPPIRSALIEHLGGRGAPGRPVLLLAEGVAVSVAATLASAPLLAHHFGSVPLASLPANLAALPVVAPIMWLGMLKAALGQAAALGPPVEPAAGELARMLGVAARPPLGWLATVAERAGELPGSGLRLPIRSPLSLAGSYALLLAGVLGVRRAARRLAPGAASVAAGWRRLPAGRRAAVLAGLAAVLGLGAARLTAAPAPPRNLTVRFLDVGQGDATLVQDPSGATVLFDGGPPEAHVTRLLRGAGVRRLDVVVATHPSRDHHGGLPEVLDRYPVGLLLDGGDGTRDPTFRALERTAARRGVRTVPALAPLRLGAGGLSIQVLSPLPRPPGPPPADPNPRAVVAVVSEAGFDLLLSGDAESDALLPLALPPVEAIKVPHHGSSDPGLPEVLRRLHPDVAAVEVGAHNPYGHPAPSTLGALRRAGARVWRTDEDGTVTLTVHHGRIGVRGER